MDLEDEVPDLALIEGQGFETVGDGRRGREFVEGLPDDELLEARVRRGEEGREVLIEVFVGRPDLASPDLPEIRPAQEERPPGLEERFVGARDAGDDRLARAREQEDQALVRGQAFGAAAALLQALPDPRHAAADEHLQGRRVRPELGFAPDQAEIDGQALEIDPGGDVGG